MSTVVADPQNLNDTSFVYDCDVGYWAGELVLGQGKTGDSQMCLCMHRASRRSYTLSVMLRSGDG